MYPFSPVVKHSGLIMVKMSLSLKWFCLTQNPLSTSVTEFGNRYSVAERWIANDTPSLNG